MRILLVNPNTTASMTRKIEAAAAARQREMVQVLLELGAAPDPAVWQRAYCISDADSVRELLRSSRPPGERRASKIPGGRPVGTTNPPPPFTGPPGSED